MPTNTKQPTYSFSGGAVIPTASDPAAISADALKPVQPYKLPEPMPSTTQSDLAAVGSIDTTFKDIYGTMTPAEVAQNDTRNALQKTMERIFGRGGSVDSSGKVDTSGALASAQDVAAQKLGYKDYSTLTGQLTDISSQITALQNEAKAIPLKAEEGAIGNQSTYGQQVATNTDLRRISIKALGLGSMAAALQGNVARAEDMATRAVEAEFRPLQAELSYLTNTYSLNKDQIDREDSKKSLLIQAKLQDRATQIADGKDNKKVALAYANAALANYPGNTAAQQAAQRVLSLDPFSKTYLTDVLGLVGQYQVDPNKTAKDIAELEQTRQQTKYYQAQTNKLNAEASQLKLPTITNPQAGKYSAALSVILGSANFTKEQKASVIGAVNNGQDPFTVVKNQAKNIMGQTEATKVTGYETAHASLQDIQNELKNFYANGGRTDIFSGSYEKVVNNLGEVNDPKLVEIATQIAASLQIYRNAVSGTAYSVQEGKDIASIFPGINKTEGLNTAILNGRMKAFDSTIDGIYRATLGNTYNDLKKANTPTVPSPSTDPYLQFRSQLQTGEILVLRNGQPYAIKRSEYNSKTDVIPAAAMNTN